MARAALKWSAADLAAAASCGYATVARFEVDQTIQTEKIEAMRRAFEKEGVRFLHSGQFEGAVVPPKAKPSPDESSRNPNLPRVRR